MSVGQWKKMVSQAILFASHDFMAAGTGLVLMLSALCVAHIWFTEVLLLWNSPLPTARGMGRT